MGLFQKSVLNKYLKGIDEKQVNEAWERFKSHFHNSAIQENIRRSKEEQHQGEFLIDLFVKVLGYTNHPLENYNLIREQKNVKDAKSADGAIIKDGKIIAVIELKGTDTTNLTNIETQAFGYKNNQPDAVYVITSNFEKLRFYIEHSADNETFNLFQLTREEFNLLWLCLAKESIFNGTPKQIKDESLINEESVTKKLYKDYSLFRNELFESIVKKNPNFDKLTLFKKTQKLLDRFLFILFAEDRSLIPPNLIRTIINKWTDLRDEHDMYQPLYQQFIKHFSYLNTGYKGKNLEIFAYNGGLFEPDGLLDNIQIDDTLLYKHTLNLSAYDFESEVSVNILGHIFEHSLSEIEEIQAEIEGQVVEKSKTKRKKDGVFYTPKYITKYIVDNTVGNLCKEKKAELGIIEEEYEQERTGKQNKAKVKILQGKLEQYRNWLLEVTICDPACGSGAFLNQALEFLITEHSYIDELQAKLFGDNIQFPNIENSILENNIFGVDINDESVEIAKLSLWLRTAQKGRKLTSLNNNIKCGNSLIADKFVAGEKAFDWKSEFPQVFSKGGFDVIIGNPPYVTKLKPKEISFFQKNYITIQGKKYDLFRLFYEKTIPLTKHLGIHGFIVPDVILNLPQASILRSHILDNYSIIRINTISNNPFQQVQLEPVITIIRNEKKPSRVEYYDLSLNNPMRNVDSENWKKGNFDFNLKQNNITESLIEKLKSSHLTIKDISIWKKGLGVYSRQHLLLKFPETEVERIMSERPWTLNYKKDETFGRELEGKDVGRYGIKWNGAKWLSYGPWLAFQRPLEFFKGPRILVREITTHGRYKVFSSYVEEEYFNNQSIFNGILKPDSDFYLKFILAIINSTLFSYWQVETSPKANRKLFPTLLMETIENLPIREATVDLQKAFIEVVDNITKKIFYLQQAQTQFTDLLQSKFEIGNLSVKLQNWYGLDFKDLLKELKKSRVQITLSDSAEWMQFFKEQKQKVQDLKMEIDKIEKEIDQMVYALYELTPEEIAIIESQS